jgi:hypothetical protein
MIRMTQDRASGAAADKWGRETARKIASKIGAVMKGRTSNEAQLDGETIVIKCAASATEQKLATSPAHRSIQSH